MLSRIKNYRMRISVKQTLVYAILMSILLFATYTFTLAGIYYTQYHQVERELSFSIYDAVKQLENRFEDVEEHVTATLPKPPHKGKDEDKEDFRRRIRHDVVKRDANLESHMVDPSAVQETGDGRAQMPRVVVSRNDISRDIYTNMTMGMLPGVFLKISDSAGDIVYDSDVYAPALSQIREHIVEGTPIWANPNFEIVEMDNFVIYYKEVPIRLNGELYKFHFFKTITAETRLLQQVEQMLILEIFVGIILALVLGYFVSQRLLKPIRSMTNTAKSIEVSDLSTRLEVSDTKDELSDLAETFNHMLDRIQTGFKQQQRFVSDASHELRTPVTVIKGYADMLKRWGKQDEETLQEGLEAIGSEADNMQGLIEKLLFLARADQERQILKKEPLEMHSLVEDVFKKMQIADDKHEMQLLRNDAAVVLADKVAMNQLLRIFLENAVKYTPEHGVIRLSSQVTGDGVLQITFEDTGVGIAEEDKERIFQRFFRADASRTKAAGQPGGTGLGLSIAKWIAEQHSIIIDVESELGAGTKFMLTMPVI